MNKSIRAICVLSIVFAGFPAQAETWPSRLIKATIPFGAGSAADVVPRLLFDRLAAELGQPIVIENRAGAGGTLGTGDGRQSRAGRLQHSGAVLGADDRAGDIPQPGLRRHARISRRC